MFGAGEKDVFRASPFLQAPHFSLLLHDPFGPSVPQALPPTHTRRPSDAQPWPVRPVLFFLCFVVPAGGPSSLPCGLPVSIQRVWAPRLPPAREPTSTCFFPRRSFLPKESRILRVFLLHPQPKGLPVPHPPPDLRKAESSRALPLVALDGWALLLPGRLCSLSPGDPPSHLHPVLRRWLSPSSPPSPASSPPALTHSFLDVGNHSIG